MKRHITTAIIMAFLFVNAAARAQGVITTVAGCVGCSGSIAEGVPATTARFRVLSDVCVDADENVYLSDSWDSKVRRIDAITQRIYTIAGNGTSGFSGDGGPGTAAQLNFPYGICADAFGNIYIADAGRIRKVDRITGIITTYAGGGVSTAEGVPATACAISGVYAVCVDAAGNCYYSDVNKIRKVDATTRMVTTIAGDGTYGDSGDGGPATSAQIEGLARSVKIDAAGNIYFTIRRGKIRRVDAVSHIITTVAGAGDCDLEGVPAIVDSLGSTGALAIDRDTNLIAGSYKMKIVLDSNKYMYSIAGDGTITTEGAGAFDTRLYINSLAINAANTNIYFVDLVTYTLRKLTYVPLTFLPPPPTDSFNVNIAPQCSGPRITVTTNNFRSGMSVKTWFGDGQTSVQPVVGSAGCSVYGSAIINHTYPYSGTYSLKQVLYLGTTVIDTVLFTYKHLRCNDFKLHLFLDSNLNGVRDINDRKLAINVKVEVDSNGRPIDTISGNAGLVYRGYGNPGTIYAFKILSMPDGYSPSVGSVAIVYDTMAALSFKTKEKHIGIKCNYVPTYDVGVYGAIYETGISDQVGHVYVERSTCNPVDVEVTLHFSPKYACMGLISNPAATSCTGNTIVWNRNIDTTGFAGPKIFSYAVWYNRTTGRLTVGDTVHTDVTIVTHPADGNPINNHYIRIDTVRAGVDPNYIEVSPAGCLHAVVAPEQMQYTVHFENTGNDTAHNIYVMDTLSNNLDLSTLEILSASAEMNVTTTKNVGGHHILKFDFPGINLPDSSHHGLADGSVIYRIKTKGSLPRGAALTNRAGIYFDYNDVVMTNTALNDIGCNLSAPNLTIAKSVDIYPNPASDMLTIKTLPGAYAAFTISNAMGQHVVQQTITSAINTVDVKALPAGIYYITLTGEQGKKVEKFVKW